MSDTEFLDWAEENLLSISFNHNAMTEIEWADKDGEVHVSVGLALRDALRNAVAGEIE